MKIKSVTWKCKLRGSSGIECKIKSNELWEKRVRDKENRYESTESLAEVVWEKAYQIHLIEIFDKDKVI